MRLLVSSLLMIIMTFFLWACTPVDAPAEDVDWLTLRGTVLEWDVDTITDVVGNLTLAEHGMRHLRTHMLIDLVVNATYLPEGESEWVVLEDASFELDIDLDHYVDQRLEPEFYFYSKGAVVANDSTGFFLDTGVPTNIVLITSLFVDFDGSYFYYNLGIFLNMFNVGLTDKQVVFHEDEPDLDWLPVDPMGLITTILFDLVVDNMILLVDYITVYDVVHGYRLDVEMTLADLIGLDDDLADMIDDDITDLDQALIIEVFVKDNRLVLVRMVADTLTFALHLEEVDVTFMEVSLADTLSMSLTLSINLIYHLHDAEPDLPDPAMLALFREVEQFEWPDLGGLPMP
ncbi:MAG: hypothetical protein EA375_01240 [Acholeplasmataceae bacterium]|nr:MAG: hypothetical protein EA375_01240 [Acholeplasmataceae bacterium]